MIALLYPCSSSLTSLIDGHNDLPWQLRIELHNRIYDGRVDFEKKLLGHTDIQRMRQGLVGGQFWSVYVDCDTNQKHFEDPSVSPLDKDAFIYF